MRLCCFPSSSFQLVVAHGAASTTVLQPLLNVHGHCPGEGAASDHQRARDGLEQQSVSSSSSSSTLPAIPKILQRGRAKISPPLQERRKNNFHSWRDWDGAVLKEVFQASVDDVSCKLYIFLEGWQKSWRKIDFSQTLNLLSTIALGNPCVC